MKQIELSIITDLHPSTISRFINGERRRWETAKKIAVALQKDPAFLMEASSIEIQAIIDSMQQNGDEEVVASWHR